MISLRMLFGLIPLLCIGGMPEDGIRRIQAHLLLDDHQSAVSEAQSLLKDYPRSQDVGAIAVQALAAGGHEKETLALWDSLTARFPHLMQNRHLLEEIGWGFLRQGLNSSQYAVRLTALIGAYLTHDTRTIQTLRKTLRDSNAIIRAISLQMTPSLGDACLKDEVMRLLREESIWFVRLEAIRAAGALRIKEAIPLLKEILSAPNNTIEERQLASASLVQIYDHITHEDWVELATHPRAGIRQSACSLASHFKLLAAKPYILSMTRDSNPDVRIAALNSLGLFYIDQIPAQELQSFITEALTDPHFGVAITAAWVYALYDPKNAETHFTKWLASPILEQARFASAALAATGSRCMTLAEKTLKTHPDIYVRINTALGLLGQRKAIDLCTSTLHQGLAENSRMWMFDERVNPLFAALVPSRVRHIDQIPNYPEAVDRMTRLELISFLTWVEDPQALNVIEHFLKSKNRAITGFAAAMLLQEGNEEALATIRHFVSEETSWDLKFQACLVLALLGRDESVVAYLQEAFPKVDYEHKVQILEAVGRIGKTESFAFFMQALKESSQILRVAAASGLIQSVNR